MPTLNEAQNNAVETLLRITPVAGRLAEVFTAAGHRLVLVGGSVRDCLMGRLGHDVDFTTDARPDEIETLLRQVTKSTWDMGREFGTIGAMVRDGSEEWQVEITTYRADTYHPESRKPDVVFGDTLEGDLIRRDFTMNAMGIDMADQSFIDPYGGLGDIARGLIRTPAAAEISFSDDPLRMMRAARFASQLEFDVTDDVRAAMTDMAERITIISAERVRDELTKILLSDNPRAGLDLLVETGIAGYILPELGKLKLTTDEHLRHKDIYEHTLTVLENYIALEKARGHQPSIVGRLAALMHDIGKPQTRRMEDGKVTFYHHDIVGAKMARKRMQALHFSSDEIKSVAKLVELHLRFHGYGDAQWTDSAVRRYVRDAGDEIERLHLLTRADCTSRNLRKVARLSKAYDHIEERIAVLAEQEELGAIRPDLNGEQIMTILGLKPGREVGKAYNWLLERRLEEGPLGMERAEAELRAWWATL